MKNWVQRIVSMGVVVVLLMTLFLAGCTPPDTTDSTAGDAPDAAGAEGTAMGADKYRSVVVVELEGAATVDNAQDTGVSVYVGMALFSGDTVSVGEGSKVVLEMDGDKYMMADGGTVFTLEAAGKEGSGQTTIRMTAGATLHRLKEKLGEDESYMVTTPVSTVAVRGTTFFVSLRTAANGKMQADHAVMDGITEVVPVSSGGVPMDTPEMVTPGMSVGVIETEPPQEESETYESAFIRGDDGQAQQPTPYEELPVTVLEELLVFTVEGAELSVPQETLEELLPPEVVEAVLADAGMTPEEPPEEPAEEEPEEEPEEEEPEEETPVVTPPYSAPTHTHISKVEPMQDGVYEDVNINGEDVTASIDSHHKIWACSDTSCSEYGKSTYETHTLTILDAPTEENPDNNYIPHTIGCDCGYARKSTEYEYFRYEVWVGSALVTTSDDPDNSHGITIQWGGDLNGNLIALKGFYAGNKTGKTLETGLYYYRFWKTNGDGTRTGVTVSEDADGFLQLGSLPIGDYLIEFVLPLDAYTSAVFMPFEICKQYYLSFTDYTDYNFTEYGFTDDGDFLNKVTVTAGGSFAFDYSKVTVIGQWDEGNGYQKTELLGSDCDVRCYKYNTVLGTPTETFDQSLVNATKCDDPKNLTEGAYRIVFDLEDGQTINFPLMVTAGN